MSLQVGILRILRDNLKGHFSLDVEAQLHCRKFPQILIELIQHKVLLQSKYFNL